MNRERLARVSVNGTNLEL
jgi:hypothetical protein